MNPAGHLDEAQQIAGVHVVANTHRHVPQPTGQDWVFKG